MKSQLSLIFGAALALSPAHAATILNGAELFSQDTVRYGRWEMRIQFAATPGTVSSFFTYYNNSYLGQPEPWREIDIEVIGKNSKSIQSNLITGNAATRVTSEQHHASETDLSQGFHTYTLDWTPDSIVYRLDGRVIRKDLGTDAQVKDLADRAQSYRMNVWASTATGWVGVLDTTKLPVQQVINWITYSSFTPGRGPNGSDFTPVWTDDFNTLDTRRWGRGDWTFETNMADFTPNNIKVSGGYLSLILSNKGWTGNMNVPVDPQGHTRPTTHLRRQPQLQPRSGSLLRSGPNRSTQHSAQYSVAGKLLRITPEEARGLGPQLPLFGSSEAGFVLR
jgi:endo-1,3-1,4-beta-glycanase ExoK